MMAPMQIKEHLTIGNIYDLLLCDYSARIHRLAGDKVFFPLLLNVNGSPLAKLSEKLGRRDCSNLVQEISASLAKECQDYSISFTDILRDDVIPMDVLSIYVPKPKIARFIRCPNCGAIYGTDPSIHTCKYCGEVVGFTEQETLAIDVCRDEVDEKLVSIRFVPDSARKRLLDFLDNMPDRYDLILERNREYTVEANGYRLDPKYATILMMRSFCDSAPHYDEIVCIHGDVIKKLTYYMLAYLPSEYLPKTDIMHGLIVDAERKKLRGDYLDAISGQGIKKKELRAILLKHSIIDDIVVDEQALLNDKKAVVKLYVLCERIKDDRNLDLDRNGVRESLNLIFQSFLDFANSWRLTQAFESAHSFVHTCWKILKDDKLSYDEMDRVKQIQEVYFG